MDTQAWLAVALGAVALGLGGYTALLRARRRRLERRLAELERGDERAH